MSTFYCYNCKAMVQLRHTCIERFDWQHENKRQDQKPAYSVLFVVGLASVGIVITSMLVIAVQTTTLLSTVAMTIQRYVAILSNIYAM